MKQETLTIATTAGDYNDGYEAGYQDGRIEIIEHIRCYVFYDLFAGFIFGAVFAALFLCLTKEIIK